MRKPPEEPNPGFTSRWLDAGATEEEISVLHREIEAARASDPVRPARSWGAIEQEQERRAQRRSLTRVWALRCVSAACAAGAAGLLLGVLLERREKESAVDRPMGSELAAEAIDRLGGRLELAEEGAANRNTAGEIVLERGAALVDLPPRPTGSPPLVFRAGDISVEVVGTVFALRVDGNRGSVRVYEGAVILRAAGHPPKRVEPRSGILPEKRVWASAVRAPIDRWGAAAADRRSREPSSTRRDPVDRSTLARDALDEPIPHPTTGPHPEGPDSIGANPVMGPAPEERPDPIGANPVTVSRPEERPDPIGAPPSAPMRRSKESPSGSGTAVGSRGGTLAPPIDREQVAAYRRAVTHLRAGDPCFAAAELDRYLDRYPDGILREEAMLSRLEALRSCGDRWRLEEAVRHWLTEHPDDGRAPEVRGLLENR